MAMKDNKNISTCKITSMFNADQNSLDDFLIKISRRGIVTTDTIIGNKSISFLSSRDCRL